MFADITGKCGAVVRDDLHGVRRFHHQAPTGLTRAQIVANPAKSLTNFVEIVNVTAVAVKFDLGSHVQQRMSVLCHRSIRDTFVI